MSKVERELFKVYDERGDTPGVGMFASLHTTAYDLQAWEYLYGKITVEMFFKAGTKDDDGGFLEYCDAGDREHAIQLLNIWGSEIKAMEDEETPHRPARLGRWKPRKMRKPPISV